MSYFDDNEDSIIYGRRKPRNAWPAVCKRCGMHGLKWRIVDGGGWRLFENERIEHNRLKEHACEVDAADDFEVLP